MKMRGRRTSNAKFPTERGGRTVSCSCPDCRDIRVATRASEKRETSREVEEQLDSLESAVHPSRDGQSGHD